MNYLSICLHILNLDNAIRFAGIASMDNGTILSAEYRRGVAPLLTIKESELSVMQSLIRMSTRKTFEEKLGKTIYSTAVYEKINRATIVMYNDGNKADALLMVSFEKDAQYDKIITKKILPFLHEIGKGLLTTG
jgi:hypothetical protein